jgi:hypothetical protein
MSLLPQPGSRNAVNAGMAHGNNERFIGWFQFSPQRDQGHAIGIFTKFVGIVAHQAKNSLRIKAGASTQIA